MFTICSRCGVVMNTAYTEASYPDTYFTDEYRNQYGRTYEEDFDALYQFSIGRVETINRVINKYRIAVQSVCDIGCALGFFLKACIDRLETTKECRYDGVEASSYAAAYCTGHYGVPVFNGLFSDYHPEKQFDLVTAWYCLEHMKDPVKAIGRIYSLLNTPGIVSFSLPSAYGPRRTFHPAEYFQAFPSDHSLDFTPSSVRLVLKAAGFSDIIIRPASIHPERVLHADSPLYPFFAPAYSIFSRITGFSDTMEVFALKR